MLMSPWLSNHNHEDKSFLQFLLSLILYYNYASVGILCKEHDAQRCLKTTGLLTKPSLVKVGIRKNKGLFTLYPVLFHFLDLSDGFSQVAGEFLAVLRVGSIEIDQDFEVSTWNG